MPTEIGDSRFLDLRRLPFALFNQALSLKKACDSRRLESTTCHRKSTIRPPAKVTIEEIKYARQDVRCTAGLLNATKREFDLHPFQFRLTRLIRQQEGKRLSGSDEHKKTRGQI